ncbi:MAG: alanine racemase [Candidatus Taylorbacteria bacterium RIFCSPHIGHO2_02_FULL_46_13]|uniref:Alanine racemase n=1 Tax=Candidatus Taylorbacteria bacterium RIFCSPHIGHO2_02_FULL_46_13 TaxID=1802312 RepID=A0A1G2MSZ2_9BACT|nr:MAG: alanine racemase [Candidatus Taylorbacteria bacterium RIFCSPHIGHO2_02_FULL_46_13]
MKTIKTDRLLAGKTNGLRTWIEVDRKAIADNVKIFRALLGKKTKLMAVVKSNAYGHSLMDFSREVEKLGVDFLGVDSVVEAFALRADGIKTQILVLGYTLPENVARAAEVDVNITISNMPALESLASESVSKPLKIHLKIDTGMHRQGFELSELPLVVQKLQALSSKRQAHLEGVYTHFAAAKNPSFPSYTNRQLQEFSKWTEALAKEGFHPVKHAAATAGAILFPDSHLDMVRIGIGLYGLWPSREVRSYAEYRLAPKPVLSWKAMISEVKKVKKGERVGYDLTEMLERDSKLAVAPIGYWHGFPRALSSVGHVIVRGTRVHVIGRVSMDMIVIDVTDVPKAEVGDEVTLLGRDGSEEITADELGLLCDTVNYEIVTRLNPLIKRIYR